MPRRNAGRGTEEESTPLREEREVLALIIGVAAADERIRGVLLSGSRANPEAPRDAYQDYDVGYYVTDMEPFYHRPEWVEAHFGKPLIMQMPEAMRNPEGDGHFNYQSIYPDGVRIDLSFEFTPYIDDGEPAVVLLDKDAGQGLLPVLPPPSGRHWHIRRWAETDYYSVCNNFWWCLNNVAKGIARDELGYVMGMLNECVRSDLHDMMNQYIGVNTGFTVSAGKMGKYYKRHLPPALYARYADTYCGADYADVWRAADVMCGLFHELAAAVGAGLGFTYRQAEEDGMRTYLKRIREEAAR